MDDHPYASLPLPVEDVSVTTPPSVARNSPSPFVSQSYGNHFGNDLFGAGYTGSGEFTYTSSNKRMFLRAEADAYATVFSFKKSVARYVLTGEAKCQSAAELKVEARAFLLGSLVDERSWGASTNKSRVFSRNRDFFSAKRTFMVGPVPVTVTANVKGEVGLDLGASLGCPAGVTLNATPYTKLNATATAGVNVLVASFGIQGSLNLINVELPREAKLEWDSSRSCPKASFQVNRDVTTLNGQIGLFAQVKVLFFKKRWDVTIAKWNGVRWNNQIVNWNQYLCP